MTLSQRLRAKRFLETVPDDHLEMIVKTIECNPAHRDNPVFVRRIFQACLGMDPIDHRLMEDRDDATV